MVVIGIVTLSFFLIHLAPGDPVVALAGESGDASYYAQMRARFGLDRPLASQYITYISHVLRGDLGTSYVQGRPAIRAVTERIPATLLLTGTALVVATLLGVALGALAARRHGRRGDLAARGVGLLGAAIPGFWLGQLALLALASRVHLFPVQGMTDPHHVWTGWRYALNVGHHLALPAAVLAAGELALVMRLVRSSVVEAMDKPFITTARGKGCSERRVLWHALRSSLLSVVTVIGTRLGFLLSGAVLVEVVFSWPGVGRLMLSSIQDRDFPVLLGILLFASVAVVVANLLTDLAYGALDPRARAT